MIDRPDQRRSICAARLGALLAAAAMLAPLAAAQEPSLESGFPLSSRLDAEPIASPRPEPNSPPAEPATGSGPFGDWRPVFQPHVVPGEVPAAPADEESWYHLGAKGRGYYLNDQRVEFTGMEATFGVEGVLSGGLHQRVGEWETMLEGEFFLNQPFDRNMLVDDPLRRSFVGNFYVDPFEISQLYIAARRGDWFLQVGRFVTPFGRFYFPIYTNNFSDSPFIRSEAILFRETGALVQWDPAPFIFTAAVTNGGFQRDTNSSKAGIFRIGLDYDYFACGASAKIMDGIGSENQKQFKNHAGIDAMFRWDRFTLSGEAIYDQYGFWRSSFDPNNIFWGRSVYYRDVNRGEAIPMNGFGYYVNLGYCGEKWSWTLNYGDYYPQKIGILQQDTPIHRALFKASYHFTRNLEMYSVMLLENSVPLPIGTHSRYGTDLILGFQYTL